ncbi:serine family amino acid catabolism-related protein [Neofusicoccum parvum]|uniref:Serine family amino acid catabolism-related protein n=1 Tax=Neofusicoccum parvum TaxID=310453 RepID=A0ACB5SC01_9PEZI|nr:serine family amino acid catabolism-related protein [Neofusicoccum parvum]
MTASDVHELPTDKRPWRTTPLVESVALSQAAGCRIFLKLENLQPSGSFKSRGIGNHMHAALLRAPDPSALHFHSSSGGNAGLACVHAANALGRPATVVVPLSTKPAMVARLRRAGARDVVQVGATWADADAHLRRVVLAGRPEAVYVPPFDHPDVWEGNAGLVREVRGQLVEGGVEGGRPAVMGLEEVGWGAGSERPVTVVAAETEGAASLYESVRKGELVTLDGIKSLATSLGAVRVAAKALENGLKENVRCVTVTDGEAAMGCLRLADEERLLVEMACGVNAALCYGGRLEKAVGRRLGKDEVVVIVVCGGSNVTVEMLAEWRKEFGNEL